MNEVIESNYRETKVSAKYYFIKSLTISLTQGVDHMYSCSPHGMRMRFLLSDGTESSNFCERNGGTTSSLSQ